LNPQSVRVIPNGINLNGFNPDSSSLAAANNQAAESRPPALGYFARMCPDKGLDILVEAWMDLKKRGRVEKLKLKIGGGCGPGDEPFVNSLREKLTKGGLLDEVEFCPNLDRAGKVAFLRSLTLFSVPARSAEAFGLYVIEALMAGVPVVQPRTGAFPELLEATSGGILYDPKNPRGLADALEELLLKPERCRALGEAGKSAAAQKFSSEAMAGEMARACQEALG
jgi:glycosyltransferase involved in cell wall biosynthesis